MPVTTLTSHEFNDCLWVRCASRGCFVNSPALKALADKYLENGGKHIVVDLEDSDIKDKVLVNDRQLEKAEEYLNSH